MRRLMSMVIKRFVTRCRCSRTGSSSIKSWKHILFSGRAVTVKTKWRYHPLMQ